MKFDFKIIKNSQSNIKNIDFNNLTFGKEFTDHMFVADYYDGQWQDMRIEPFQNLSLHPATFALHYGQSIFEGMKAELSPEGEILLFRPYENAKRFNHSAKRIAIPEIPEALFVQAIKELVKVDIDWIPTGITNSSLYIRPFMFGTEPLLGVKIGEHYKFVVILGPSGAYYSDPIKVWIQDQYVRAFKGGTGSAKYAGNYSATLQPVAEAKKHDCAQILWVGGPNGQYFQEIGTMNVFFMINNVIITPSLEEETILHGITRDAILQIAQKMGYKTEERPISIDELLEAYRNNTLQDMFGTGTAAVVYPINGFVYNETTYDLSQLDRSLSLKLKSELEGIKMGRIKDEFGWIEKVNTSSTSHN